MLCTKITLPGTLIHITPSASRYICRVFLFFLRTNKKITIKYRTERKKTNHTSMVRKTNQLRTRRARLSHAHLTLDPASSPRPGPLILCCMWQSDSIRDRLEKNENPSRVNPLDGISYTTVYYDQRGGCVNPNNVSIHRIQHSKQPPTNTHKQTNKRNTTHAQWTQKIKR